MQIRPKIIRRFYEPLLLLDALGQVRGDRIKPERDSSDDCAELCKHYRAFVDGIAYCCAYKKEPDNVTAAALESTPDSVIVWLAANEGVEERVLLFLRSLLDQVHRVTLYENVNDTSAVYSKAVNAAIDLIVIFSYPRIKYYFQIIKKRYYRSCLKMLQDAIFVSCAVPSPSHQHGKGRSTDIGCSGW